MTEQGRSIVQFHPNAVPGFDVLRYGMMAATACNYTSYSRRVLLREWCNCGVNRCNPRSKAEGVE